MKRILLAATAALALATTQAQAITLGGQAWSFSGVDNLVLTPVVPGGNQPLNIQCVICGDNQPQQDPLFGYTNYKNAGNLTNALFFSTNVSGGANPGLDTVGLPYSLGLLDQFAGAVTFTIGIDVNDNNTAQTLNSFFLLNLTTHTVLSAFTTPTDILSQNNGTGFPDYTLSGFNIQLGTDIHAGDQLLFFANLGNLSDGPDSFFLVPNAAPVPAPIVGAGLPGLLGLGMLWLARLRQKRNGKVAVA